jgi:hypothetical protein
MNTEQDKLHPAVREARVAEHLDRLKDALGGVHAPASIEGPLLREFRARKVRAERAARPRLWWMPPLALAATVGLVSWMVRGPAPLPASDPGPTFTLETDDGPFLALKPVERIRLEPAATVVTTQFPRALLAQWGLPVAPEQAGEPVRAEMLYSPEGEALAIRLLN